jgi:hypothetical protein
MKDKLRQSLITVLENMETGLKLAVLREFLIEYSKFKVGDDFKESAVDIIIDRLQGDVFTSSLAYKHLHEVIENAMVDLHISTLTILKTNQRIYL